MHKPFVVHQNMVSGLLSPHPFHTKCKFHFGVEQTSQSQLREPGIEEYGMSTNAPKEFPHCISL